MPYSQFPTFVHGDDGYNSFLSDGAGSSFIYAYGGNDVVTAHATDLYLGPGPVGYYHDYFDGGDGDEDIVNYELATTAVDVNLTTGVAWRVAGNGVKYAPDILLNFEGARGSDYNDKLKGNAFANLFNGHAGNDQISGYGGDDYIVCGSGNDWAHGGADDDVIEGGTGNDDVIGGAGDDWIRGGPGADDVWLGTGADTAHFGYADFGIDTIHDFELGVDRLQFAGNGFFAQAPGNGVELSDLLGAFSVWGGNPDDSWLVANTTDGLQTVALVKGVSADDMNAAIADESILVGSTQLQVIDFLML
ncbi:MAG: hypothetical protein AAFX81_06050 [Pseudomonadota bacterium]